jgi:hypothetical protein
MLKAAETAKVRHGLGGGGSFARYTVVWPALIHSHQS